MKTIKHVIYNHIKQGRLRKAIQLIKEYKDVYHKDIHVKGLAAIIVAKSKMASVEALAEASNRKIEQAEYKAQLAKLIDEIK